MPCLTSQAQGASLIGLTLAGFAPYDKKTFNNTFAPNIENDELNVHKFIMGMRATVLRYKNIPRKVQAVTAELERQNAGKRV